MKATFTADQFTPTQWTTAEEKAKFANHFVRFVTSGFKQSLFTKAFYNRLCQTTGHIAHYNQHGFWETFFTNTADKARFIEQSVTFPCYGDPAWTFSDVERAIQNWLVENRVLANLREEASEEQTASELATLARLKAKYPNV